MCSCVCIVQCRLDFRITISRMGSYLHWIRGRCWITSIHLDVSMQRTRQCQIVHIVVNADTDGLLFCLWYTLASTKRGQYMTPTNNKEQGFAHWIAMVVVLAIIGAVGVLGFGQFQEKTGFGIKVDVNNPPKFIQADFIDLSKIYSISKYRSGQGHDFSGNGETCRSMKHYYHPQEDPSVKMEKAADGRSIPPKPDGVHDINIFSPVDGRILQIASERMPVGEQIYIEPTDAKDFTIRLFHVYKDDGIKEGTELKAGQKIGVISGYSTTDISVEGGSEQFVSYFQVMPDSVFAAYKKRGATSRNDFIFSREYRDAHPIPCDRGNESNQQFHYPAGYDQMADNFYLTGYVKPDYSQMQQGQHNLNQTH